jgi:hypothetical protein
MLQVLCVGTGHQYRQSPLQPRLAGFNVLYDCSTAHHPLSLMVQGLRAMSVSRYHQGVIQNGDDTSPSSLSSLGITVAYDSQGHCKCGFTSITWLAGSCNMQVPTPARTC